MSAALIVVDMQNDFMPDGALAVPDGDVIIPRINELVESFRMCGQEVIFTKDWHKATTKHFEKWPPHCVRDTPGAELHPDLNVHETDIVIHKGLGNRDGYSAFETDKHGDCFLEDYFRDRGIHTVFVCGVATDYCVLATCRSAVSLGYEVFLVGDATLPVDASAMDAVLSELTDLQVVVL